MAHMLHVLSFLDLNHRINFSWLGCLELADRVRGARRGDDALELAALHLRHFVDLI